MATSKMREVIHHLLKIVHLREGVGLTDGQLLEDYISRREEAALAALVHRHGPMVWGVCRRVLRNHHDAEDAFQATFLVLVRKAASIASRELLANWLYGVAYRTALKARATAARRRARERLVTEIPEPEVVQQDVWHDLQPLLDQELSHLPDKYRVPILLCDLEGKTRKEAARQLGVPEGTVAGRLARARTMLAKRLARHGVVLPSELLAAVWSQNAASACVPTVVMSSTIKAASLFAAGPAATTGVISVQVATLTEGVLKAMWITKLKITLAIVACMCVGVLGPVLALTAYGVVGTTPLPNKSDQPMPKPSDPAANATETFIGTADQWPRCMVTVETSVSSLPAGVGRRFVYLQGSGAVVIREVRQVDAFGKQQEKRYSLKLTAAETSALRKLCIEANPVAVQLAARPGVPGSSFLTLTLRNAAGKEHQMRCLAIDKDKVAEFRKLFDAVDELKKKNPPTAKPDYEGEGQPQWRPFAKPEEK